jgi:DNA polymerase-3 subunit beta
MFIEKINKDVLLKPLQTVVGIVERKQPLPILSNVLIEKNKTGIRFVATDLEIQITTEIKDSEFSGENESITVAAKKLQEILRVLPDNSKITLIFKIQIAGQSSQSTICKHYPHRIFQKSVSNYRIQQ